jgi:hypothetical protein
MKINSFEEACEKLGLDPAACLPDVSGMPAKLQPAVTATAKMYIITEAANEGKEFDWNDEDQRKWYAWFDMEEHKKNNPSGCRFGAVDCTRAITCAGLGSRLCFFSSEDAEFHGRTHEAIYRDMMVTPK